MRIHISRALGMIRQSRAVLFRRVRPVGGASIGSAAKQSRRDSQLRFPSSLPHLQKIIRAIYRR